jgi:hypothetical protein
VLLAGEKLLPVCQKKKIPSLLALLELKNDVIHFDSEKLLFDSIRRIQVGRWLWSAKPARKRGQQQTTRRDSRGLSSKGVSDTSKKGC